MRQNTDKNVEKMKEEKPKRLLENYFIKVFGSQKWKDLIKPGIKMAVL